MRVEPLSIDGILYVSIFPKIRIDYLIQNVLMPFRRD